MMKKLIALFILIPGFLFAQYWGERSIEESFEMSELYFTSHYLNTFALQDFRKAAAGLIDDPFLRLYINPADLPGQDSTALLYLDFRGDRNIAPLVDHHVYPMALYTADYIYRPYYIDPRWISVARSEPEPVVSVGLLTYPLKGVLDKLLIGATYQFIYKQEKYYELPYWIYNSRYLYDAFGVRASGDFGSYPVIDRESRSDEMLTQGHLLSAFAGLKLAERLSLGASINAVIHSRDGQYANADNSEYGNTSSYKYSTLFEQKRNQDYDHFDYSAGLLYGLSERFSFGVKVGLLKGEADQDYTKINSYYSINNTPGQGTNWYDYNSNGSAEQIWNEKGTTRYAGVNFRYSRTERTEVSGYYRYSQANIDLTNSSVITDTMNYSSKWTDSQNRAYLSSGVSKASDFRTGSGSRNYYMHEGMLRFRWFISGRSTVSLGLYANSTDKKSRSLEPANVSRMSRYQHDYPPGSGGGDYNYLNVLDEIKTLEWIHRNKSFSLQIPVVLNFKIDDTFSITLAVNRILNNWEITEQTTAYFELRRRNENGSVKEERKFGERYINPAQNISETDTDFAGGVDINVSPQFQINLLLDPEFVHDFRLSQWWIGFRAGM